ncbi:hypothetical protein [Poriferisphaera corsica]|nr:hypothetical protein [Poriferisphaera corsica]
MSMKWGQPVNVRHFAGGLAFCFTALIAGQLLHGQAALNDNTVGNDRRGYVPENVVQGGWRPVDQTVSDLSSNSASQRRLNHGNALFNNNITMYTRDDNGQLLTRGLPTVDFRTSLHVPTEYQFRAPGVTALVQRPEYVSLVGPDPRWHTRKNKQPFRDGLFADIGSAGMVYNLDVRLLNPVVNADRTSLEPARVHYSNPIVDPVTIPQPLVRINAAIVNGRIDGRLQTQQVFGNAEHVTQNYDPTVDGRFFNPADKSPRQADQQ